MLSWTTIIRRFWIDVGHPGRMHRSAILTGVLIVALVVAGCAPATERTTTSLASDSVPTKTTIEISDPASTHPTSVTTLVEATSTTTTTEPLPPLERLSLEVVADRLDQPVFVAPGPDRNVLLVVEREGIIRIVDSDGAVEDLPFLDLTDVVGSSGIEQGLLGMALHPVDVSRMFVYYSLPSNDTVLAELPIAGELPDIGGLTEILRFEQPTERHNAGMIQFGPDGYLYLSLGEGGAASTHAQDPNTLLSSILRLDVDGGAPYLVPADNPFVGGGGAPEVWAFGLRNPWRFDIDPVDGLMYIADVGHSDWEEIDVVSLDGGGYNFGWLTMEGSHCFSSTDCDTDGLELPAAEYPHSEGCSVTGGYVYRGSAIPEIEGHYFYGDWCTGFIRSFRYVDGAVVDERDWTDELGFSGQVNSFGLDAAGELLIATWDGTVYRVVPIR